MAQTCPHVKYDFSAAGPISVRCICWNDVWVTAGSAPTVTQSGHWAFTADQHRYTPEKVKYNVYESSDNYKFIFSILLTTGAFNTLNHRVDSCCDFADNQLVDKNDY